MPIIETPPAHIVDRKGPEEVLALPDSAPSRVGSTYWRRPLACPREHLISNLLKWAPTRRSDALDFGLVWHYGLETYYTALMQKQQGQILSTNPDVHAFRLLEKFGNEPGWEEGYRTLSRMLQSYLEEHDRFDTNNWKILAVEETLELTKVWGLGFEYSVRLDLLIEDHTTKGVPLLKNVEHKSAASLDANTLSGYNQDLQILGQYLLCDLLLDKEVYAPYVGVIVNITTKQETPKHARLPVQPNEAMIEAFEQGMRWGERMRTWIEQEGEYPRNYGSCIRRWGKCPHFNLCNSYPQWTGPRLISVDQMLREQPEAAQWPTGYRSALRADFEELV